VEVAEFDCDQCSSFYNIKDCIFGVFGLKKPIRVLKIGVWEDLTPKCGVISTKPPKLQKGIPVHQTMSFELPSMKMCRCV